MNDLICAECGEGAIIFVGGHSDPITRCQECGAIEGETLTIENQ